MFDISYEIYLLNTRSLNFFYFCVLVIKSILNIFLLSLYLTLPVIFVLYVFYGVLG